MVVRARDVMTRMLVTVGPEDPAAHARRLVVDHGLDALPVVDAGRRVVGVVGAVDLLGLAGPEAERVTVGALMSSPVLTAGPRTTARVIAHRLGRYGGHRVMPIVEHGRLVGVVTRRDLLRPSPRTAFGRLVRRVRESTAPAGRSSEPRHVLPVLGTPPPSRLPVEPPPAQPCRARDVMTVEGIVVVTSAMSTVRAAELLVRSGRSELPVVDASGTLLGVVGESDLLAEGERRPTTVAAVMSTDVVAVGPDAEVGELERLLAAGGVRSVPVVEDGVLVGVVSRRDLLRRRPR